MINTLLSVAKSYIWKNIKKSHKNNKLKISVLTWNDKFKLSDGSYSVLDIPDFLRISSKNMWQ